MAETAENLNQTQETDLTPSKPQLSPDQLVVQDNSDLALLLDSAKFNQAWRAATAFAKSKLVPAHFQGSTENCFVALVLAEQLNVAPFMVMNKTYVVHGRPGMEAQLVIALVNTRGPFTGPIQWRFEGEGNDRSCTAYATHAKTGQLCEATVDWKMVVAEGWNQDKQLRDGKGVQKSKWNTMERMMFMYRSATFLARLYCPEVVMGLSTVEELQDTDIIDVEVSAIPEPIDKKPQAESIKEELKQRRVRSDKGQPRKASEPPAETPTVEGETTGQDTGKDPTEGNSGAQDGKITHQQQAYLEAADKENTSLLLQAWRESGIDPTKTIPQLSFEEADAIIGTLEALKK